jgi:hypothetical protein
MQGVLRPYLRLVMPGRLEVAGVQTPEAVT